MGFLKGLLAGLFSQKKSSKPRLSNFPAVPRVPARPVAVVKPASVAPAAPISPFDIEVIATGKGKRSKFTATKGFACTACAHQFRTSVLGIEEGFTITCPACSTTRALSTDECDDVRGELEDEITFELEDLELDPDEDELDFIFAHGRWPKASEKPTVGYPVGLAWENLYADAVARAKPGQHVELHPEPDNPHDPLAIAVLNGDGEHLGYIPRKSFVRKALLEEDQKITAKIWKVEKGKDGNTEIVLDVIPHGDGR